MARPWLGMPVVQSVESSNQARIAADRACEDVRILPAGRSQIEKFKRFSTAKTVEQDAEERTSA